MKLLNKLIAISVVIILLASPVLLSKQTNISFTYDNKYDEHGYVFRGIIEDLIFGRNGGPFQTEALNIEELREIITNEFGDYFNLHLSDPYYETTEKNHMEAFLRADQSEYFGKDREFWDCDDYAYRFQGQITTYWPSIACGIIWYGCHAGNIFIDNDHEIWIINAKSNGIYQLDDDETISVIMI